MRIVTFNVNGLRSIKEYYTVSKGWNFDEFLDSFSADILCFQETKINDESRMAREYAMPRHFAGYSTFQRGAKKIGYSGVISYCRKERWEPRGYEEGFSGLLQATENLVENNSDLVGTFEGGHELLQSLDSEGRCVVTDHGHFVLINLYFPNDSGPQRNEFRVAFYNAVWSRCLSILRAGRSLILLGDINVTYLPIDHCDYGQSFQNLERQLGSEFCYSTIEKYHMDAKSILDCKSATLGKLVETFYGEKILRSWLYKLLHLDPEAKHYHLQDAFRLFHAGEYQKYTCWNTLMSARGTNHGTRLDMILTAGPLFEKEIIKDCGILPTVMGSDHCPVYIDLDLEPIAGLMSQCPRNLKSHQTQRTIAEFFSPKNEKNKVEASMIKEESPLPLDANPTKKSKVAKLSLFFETIPRQSPTLVDQVPIDGPKDETFSWRDLFKPKVTPLCRGHSEPCKLLTVNKRGVNQGRQFYTCARGVGAKDDPNARCSHFEWFATGNKNT